MTRLTAILLAVLAALSSSAQHREEITVEVVDVPVYVRHDGQPVDGLTRDDFELFVDGKRQPIDYFDVIGDVAPPESLAATPSPAQMRERRLFMLVFDLTFARSYVMKRAQKAAAQWIGRATPDDYFAVAAFSGNRGLQFIVPFTRDQAVLHRAVRQLASISSPDPLRLMTPAAEASTTISETQPDGDPEDLLADDPVDPEWAREVEGMAMRPFIESQVRALGEVAGRLAPLEGEKHMVLLSEGFNVAATKGFHPGPGPGAYITNLTKTMHEQFHAADVLLHTLDTGGLREIKEGPGAESLHMLASGTGGDVINDRNDVGAALSDLTRSYSRGYRLGFRPARAKRGHHRIVVRVKGERGWNVTHRRGFRGDPADVDPQEGLLLADVVLNDVPQSGVAAVIETEEGILRARIPLTPLAGAPTADLLVYVFDQNGAVVGFTRRTLKVPPGVNANAIVPLDDLRFAPGTYMVKALLRAGTSLGLSRFPLTVRE